AALADAVLAQRGRTGRRLSPAWRRAALATATAEALRRRIEEGGAAIDELAEALAEGGVTGDAALDRLADEFRNKR
ncbi:hypothetical protein, partial [Desertibaculum subflavum]|uniref:hypothetical protein n=1 Tax=Desertibaculum subflavum TaxID=2268458 RepID=UPI0013C483DB